MESDTIRNCLIGSTTINTPESLKERIYKEREYRISRITDALSYSFNEEILERIDNQSFKLSLVDDCLRKGCFSVSIDTCPLSQWPYKANKWEIPIHRLLSKYCFEKRLNPVMPLFWYNRKQIRFEDIPLQRDLWINWLQEVNVQPDWESLTRKVYEGSSDFQNMIAALEKEGFSIQYSVHAVYKSIATISIY